MIFLMSVCITFYTANTLRLDNLTFKYQGITHINGCMFSVLL